MAQKNRLQLESEFKDKVDGFTSQLPLAQIGVQGEMARKVVEELERKIAWAFGTTYGMPYQRGANGLALLARHVAYLFIEGVGLPD